VIPKYKQHSILGLSIGIGLAAGGAALASNQIIPGEVGVVLFVVGVGIYIWGCAALAKAKGYSTAIILTAVLGLLFPMVVLLALRDKNRHYRGRD